MANNTIGKEMRQQFSIENNNNNNNKNEINKLDNTYKLITTWILCICSLVYGLTTYIIGPALNDMKVKLNETTDTITLVFGAMLIGYTLGAVINGIIFNFINRQLVLTILFILMGAAVALVPFCPNLGLLLADGALCGFGGGGIDTAQVVWIIEMWAEKSSIYLSAYQFFFALGTFISPLMTRPYLAEEITNTSYTKTTVTTLSTLFIEQNQTDIENEQNSTQTITTNKYTESRIEIPFGIVGSLLVISGLILLVLHFYRRYVPPVEQSEQFVCKCPNKWKLIYITLGLLTLAPYVGMEIMNFQLIDTFAKNSHLDLSAADSALVHSYLAGAFALLRGIIFFISIKFWSEKTLYVNYLIIIIGNTVLFLYEYNQLSKYYLWTGAVLCGTGFSSVFPSVYAFLENQFTITNTIGGLFVCISGLMAAILPTICGQFIAEQPLSLVYLNYICTAVISISFILFNLIIYNKSKSESLMKNI